MSRALKVRTMPGPAIGDGFTLLLAGDRLQPGKRAAAARPVAVREGA
jgi:hypothetical protein